MAREMIEVPADANGENEISEQRMFETYQQQGARIPVSHTEQGSADCRESNGNPISKNNVDKSEEQSARHDYERPAAKKRLETVKKVSAIYQLLRIHGKNWIKNHHQEP